MVGWCGCEGFGGQMLKGVFGCGMIGVGEIRDLDFNGYSNVSLDLSSYFALVQSELAEHFQLKVMIVTMSMLF